jgi:hypothetical protein
MNQHLDFILDFILVLSLFLFFFVTQGIINQLGPDNLENLKKIAEQYQGGAADAAGAGDDDDDDVRLIARGSERASEREWSESESESEARVMMMTTQD